MSGPDHQDLAAQLRLARVGRRHPPLQQVEQTRQQRIQRGRRHGIATKMFRLDDAEQGAPKVDDQQLSLRGGLRPNDLAAQGP